MTTAVEAQQQVLPDRADVLQDVPVHGARDPRGLAARVRRRGGNTLAEERLQRPSDPAERVTFRHCRRMPHAIV